MLNRILPSILIGLSILYSSHSFAQNNFWIELESQITESEFFERYSNQIGSKEFKFLKSEFDDLGMEHRRYLQYQDEVPVEGSVLLMHANQDLVHLVNGNTVKGIISSSIPSLSPEEALENALLYMNADRYAWQSLNYEGLIKRIEGDEDATWYPVPELVYVDPNYTRNGENYKLSYKMDIHSIQPNEKKVIFVDAQNGSILFEQNSCVHSDAEGTAETLYHGTRTIITDSLAADSFRLVDMTRGGGIETYNLLEETDIDSAVHFYDSDNYWNNFNANMDQIATDVHWASEMTYDYFLEKHDRDSYDNEGTPIISYVHYGENVYNAFWNGAYASYGDGGSEPFTYIDIIGHELTHGVIRTSAGLIYQDESGALNESFADIFGKMVEGYGFPEGENWSIGSPGNILRHMDDPNSINDPDTYLGDYYYTGTGDNGGVHTNSSVQNYWFYLLTDGGSGVNSNDDEYEVIGLGLDNAASIAYRNLNYYLTPSSNFMDARVGALYSAEDLFGPCSEEVIQTGKAWHAVGVGESSLTHDIRANAVLNLESSCDLTDEEYLTVRYIYHGSGCDEKLLPGDFVSAAYEIEGFPIVYENIELTDTLGGGDTLEYVFNAPLDLEIEDRYWVNTWANIDGDIQSLNDSILDFKVIHVDGLDEDEVLGFQEEDYVELVSYNIIKFNSEIRISPFAGNGSSRGLQMNGRNFFNPNQVDFDFEEDSLFIKNPNFEAQSCICMDTEGWENVRLSFDLKQTYSEYYEQLNGEVDPTKVSSLRVLVNDESVSPIYHPTTSNDDDFVTHVINLDSYAGTQFLTCFQGKHFIRKEDDPAQGISEGDNSYIDNVFFTQEQIVTVEEDQIGNHFSFYPNPSKDFITIVNRGEINGTLIIYDNVGKLVMSTFISSGENRVELTGLSKGIYSIQMMNNNQSYVDQLIIR